MNKKTDDPVGELRQATREAHEAMKDMRALLTMMKDVREDLLKVTAEVFEERMDAEVKRHLEEYSASMTENIDRSTQAVYDRFDRLARIMLGKGTKSDIEAVTLTLTQGQR